MPEYDNVWTKLNLGWLRGNPLFRAVLRAVKVGVVAVAEELVRHFVINGGIGINWNIVILASLVSGLEKASRTLVLEKK